MPDIDTIIDTPAAIVSLIEADIIKVFVKPNLEFKIKNVDEITDAVKLLSEGNRVLLIVDVSENTTGDKEVREYGAKHGSSQYAKATAFVTSSLAQKLVVNFFITLYRKKENNKMFTNEKDAIEWLQQYR